MRLAPVLLLLLVGAAHAQLLHQTVPSPTPSVDGGFGISTSSASDFDGDGTTDVLVGAWSEPVGALNSAGRAYLISGIDGSVLLPLTAPTPEASADFGFTVERVGDLTGDGVRDFAIAATGEDVGANLNAGRVHLYSGADGAYLRSLESTNVADSGSFGIEIASVPDLTSDGVDDLLIGANDDVGGRVLVGRAYLFNGATGALIRQLDTPSTDTNVRFGEAVAAVDDANGDDVADLLIGSWQDEGGEGIAYLFSGATGALLRTHLNPAGGPDPNTFQRSFGWTVASHPDINADGVGDYLIGTLAGFVASGKAYVYSGANGALLRTYAPPLQADFAFSVSINEDFDGDGVDDPLFGDWVVDDAGGTGGNVRAFSGATGAPLFAVVTPNPERMGWFGYDVAALPTSAGGTFPGFVAGAAGEDGGGIEDAGRVYLYTLAPFQVEIAALDPPEPVVVAQGARFDYEITVTAGPAGGTTQVWTRGARPSGGTTSPLFGPRTLTLAPGERQTFRARQRVPVGLPPGDYEYRAYVGPNPGNVDASDAFGVEVSPSSALTRREVSFSSVLWESAEPLPSLSRDAAPREALVVSPNPTSGDGSVRFHLEASEDVRVSVHDLLGREVSVLAHARLSAGDHEVPLRGTSLPAGTYFIRLVAGPLTRVRPLTVAR